MSDFKVWQLEHYARRYAEEKAKRNMAAMLFLSAELDRLKIANYERSRS